MDDECEKEKLLIAERVKKLCSAENVTIFANDFGKNKLRGFCIKIQNNEF